MTKKRNLVLIILFITWTLSYMDRMVMTVAMPYVAKDFNLSQVSMGCYERLFCRIRPFPGSGRTVGR
jgi:sugar phosphate permease